MERYNVYTVHNKTPRSTVHSQRRKNTAMTAKKFSVNSLKSAVSNTYFAMMFVIIIGAVIGALYLKNSGVTKTALDGTGVFMQDMLCQQAASRSFMSLFLSAFFPIGCLLCLMFLFGLCAVGMPFEVINSLFWGFWTGGCMASVYIRYGIKGLGICLIFILPQTIINSLAVIVSAKEGTSISSIIYKMVFKGENKKFDLSFKRYCCKYAVCFALIAVSSVIEAAAIKIFALIFFS